LSIISDISEDTIVDQIEAATREAQFVIVDLEGTASLMVANAIGLSDLVVIPTQGASMDAKGAAKTIKLIRNQERMARRQIPHAVLLTRTSAAIASRALKNVRDQLDKAGIDVFMTSIVERAAYRDLFDYGGSLDSLDPSLVANLDKAKENAREYVGEILKKLRTAGTAAKVA
jgi:chromosome partitioning protein